jgi:dynein intermediate chain
VLQSESFSSFFTRASKKVERILGAPILADLLLDANYAGTSSSVEQDQEQHEKSKSFIKNKWLSPGAHSRIVLECPTWSKTRAIHDIHWSPIHKELILATYDTLKSAQQSPTIQGGGGASIDTNIDKLLLLSKSNNAPSDSLAVRSYEHLADGVALLWSLAMPHRPEHVVISNSPILCARFHPTEPHLIIGGCYSGQLMLWDLRAGRLPIQKSTLAITATDKNTTTWKGHAHPLCAMEVVEGGVSNLM